MMTLEIDAETLAILAGEPEKITEAERAALRRLIEIAQRDTGQSRRVASFLLAWWNAGSCGGFDLTELWAVDEAVARDMHAVVGLVMRLRNYPDVYAPRSVFVDLVAQWRPHLMLDAAPAEA